MVILGKWGRKNMNIQILKKTAFSAAILLGSLNFSINAKNNCVVSFFNDSDATVIIDKIVNSPSGYASIENGTRILPGEELTVGTNIKEFTIKENGKKYRIALPLEVSDRTLTIRLSTIKAIILGIVVKELSRTQ